MRSLVAVALVLSLAAGECPAMAGALDGLHCTGRGGWVVAGPPGKAESVHPPDILGREFGLRECFCRSLHVRPPVRLSVCGGLSTAPNPALLCTRTEHQTQGTQFTD